MSDNKSTDGVSAEFISQLTGLQKNLSAFILSLVRDPVDADDVLQECNMVMWRKSDEFEPGTQFKAWAFSIARYQVMAYRKRNQRSRLHFDDQLVEILAEEATQWHVRETDPMLATLSHCLKKLSDEQKRLIAERYEPGGCVNDMAEAQGRSPKAVSEALRRIRKNLMTCIEANRAAFDNS